MIKFPIKIIADPTNSPDVKFLTSLDKLNKSNDIIYLLVPARPITWSMPTYSNKKFEVPNSLGVLILKDPRLDWNYAQIAICLYDFDTGQVDTVKNEEWEHECCLVFASLFEAARKLIKKRIGK